ncbi:DNA-binding protein, HU family [Wolbachia endosymbiont of Armadillidium vulgare str. wVulC]|uniref:HU family DNA-binding protein n=1 Tax=unclassified Wolbachia TaxID=2640676 RepID=UPI00064A1854|nr:MULTISPECIES: HU family DNA-binding protein [unclassified Wolbachia]KLT22111.1 DNA-binding protein, HU family [Wolbachia endosymbiont of Armadillidium vulgare str. wVulC]OJH33157.1 DNA-binding protein HRL53 [Wolbachia endosymbiont of Armadillidium vulgare]RDD35184.1 HU family DNA-binding protein [Wolbachia endosymbiont of Cylisticus convexus]
MSKEDITKQLKEGCASQGICITQSDSNKLYDTFMGIIKNEINCKGEIRLHGIGTLSTVISQERQCRNPQNGKIMTVPEKTRIKFKPSKTFLSIVRHKKKVPAI